MSSLHVLYYIGFSSIWLVPAAYWIYNDFGVLGVVVFIIYFPFAFLASMLLPSLVNKIYGKYVNDTWDSYRLDSFVFKVYLIDFPLRAVVFFYVFKLFEFGLFYAIAYLLFKVLQLGAYHSRNVEEANHSFARLEELIGKK